MKVKLTRDYACAPEGHTVHHHVAGEVIHDRAAEMALADGAGVAVAGVEMGGEEPLETKITTPPETKTPGRGRPKKA